MLELLEREQIEELFACDVWEDEWESMRETEEIDWSMVENFN